MRFIFLKLFSIFSILLHGKPLKLFKFHQHQHEQETQSSSSNFNLAKLKNDVAETIQSTITICSSHKQEKIHTLNTHTIYVVYKNQSFQTPWFNIGFWNNAVLWANVDHLYWYNLGKAKSRELHDWIHICVEINLDSNSLRASIQGKIFPTVYNVSGLSAKHELNLGLGLVDHSMNINEKVQFFGSITNINIYRNKEKSLLNKMAENPCYFPEKEALLMWTSMNWDFVGQVIEKNIENKTLCSPDKYINLRLPFLWRKSTAKDTCAKLGNGKLTDFSNPSNLSSIDLENMYGKHYSNCKYFWTPYTDETNEGVFINENNGKIERYQFY